MDFNHAQEYWNSQAVLEAKKNCGVGYQNVRSPCNVFILDTSSSLGKDGFAQMKEMFSIIIDGMLIVGFQSKEYNHIMSLARIIIHVSKQTF